MVFLHINNTLTQTCPGPVDQAWRKSSEKYKVNHPHQQFPLVLLLTVELLIPNDPLQRLLCKTDIIQKYFYTFGNGLLQLVAILFLLFISLITIMVTLQQIGNEHKVFRWHHITWKNSLLPKLLKVSSSGQRQWHKENLCSKQNCLLKGKLFENVLPQWTNFWAFCFLMSILDKDFSYFSGKFRNFNILQSLCKILSPEAIGEDKYGKVEEGGRREARGKRLTLNIC